jgi:hypothetical protein
VAVAQHVAVAPPHMIARARCSVPWD